MSLLGNLYSVESISYVESKLDCIITINENHELFNGHFPGNPIVPGVCSVQIIGELLSLNFGKEYHLVSSDNIKFITLVNPLEYRELRYEVSVLNQSPDSLAIKCIVTGMGVETLKMKGEYRCQAV
ncbi:MAG: hypothetical protein HXX13_03670 [Bacteroidetes bacterium]|nr:hypothetical protein [Bacteroidota bacterium]